MKPPETFVTRTEAEKLIHPIQTARHEGYRGRPYLKMLAGAIEKAQISMKRFVLSNRELG